MAEVYRAQKNILGRIKTEKTPLKPGEYSEYGTEPSGRGEGANSSSTVWVTVIEGKNPTYNTRHEDRMLAVYDSDGNPVYLMVKDGFGRKRGFYFKI